jgi:hypothetical protein
MKSIKPTESKPATESKPTSTRGGRRPGAGRKPRAVKDIVAAVDSGKITYVRADTACGVRSLFTQLLDEAGASDKKLAQRIAEGLDAEETIFAKHKGKITDRENVVAWSERRAYTELACKIKQVMPKDEESSPQPIQVNIRVLGVGVVTVNG